MKKPIFFILFILLVVSCTIKDSKTGVTTVINSPIQLHPENPHYFLFRGKTMALVTSAEHYGSVLNLDFNYSKYLETLSEAGMNYTRIFTGTYFEIEGQSFSIQNNTLAPAIDKVITPWTKVEYENSGKFKYDLSKWNDAYFERLREFMTLAAEKNIIVEVTLFSSIYRDDHWNICPQNPENNINVNHEVLRQNAQTLNNGSLLDYQLSFVRKMINELNDFDNFFFELQNEPWSDHPVAVYNIVNREDLKIGDWTYKADFANEESMAWQEKIAATIVEEENKLPNKHLIAQNYSNFRAPVPVVNNNISIINFHYAWPEAAEWNYHYNRVIGFDESGFAGSGDQVYRRQAWQFMLSGGGLFNNLDYSFFAGHEDGLGENKAPGGGSDSLRKQLMALSQFLHSFELEKLHPDKSCIQSSPGLIPYILSDKTKAFAVFLRATGTKNTILQLKTDGGSYVVQSLDPISGLYSDSVTLKSRNGVITLNIDIPEGELALKIIRE